MFWTAADIGWVTGHSYIVYGPLSNGATSIMYEGTPDTPNRGRWWEIVSKYKVSILYCAPTAIRTFMKWGEDIPAKYDLSSLRLLGSVGEPINPEAYIWYRQNIGGGRCPVVDTWWQTETGALMISPLPGVTSGKPGAAMRALPGITVDVVDDNGTTVPDGGGGFLVIKEPWPSMLRTIWGDDERYVKTYWSRFEGMYFAGDGAKKDADGDICGCSAAWTTSCSCPATTSPPRRLSPRSSRTRGSPRPPSSGPATRSPGRASWRSPSCAGTAGQDGDDLATELRNHVSQVLGPICRPRQILVVAELPKTRSGKIMRRLLRDVAEHRVAR